MSRGKKTRRPIYHRLIEVSMFPLSLVKIGQIVKKGQPCFEIEYGGGRHLEWRLLRFFQDTDVL